MTATEISALLTTNATTMITGITSAVTTVLPIAVGVFALFYGIRLFPKLIKKFAK